MSRILPLVAVVAALLPLAGRADHPNPQPPASNLLNPAMGLILSGTYARFSEDPETYFIPGFALAGHEAGPGEEGLSLAESELILSANADNLFLGYLNVALTPENEAEVEEAYIQTIGLAAGVTVKAGRFLSAIGYLNEQHPHVWDFVDAPLPYRAMLGGHFGDDGVQLRWLAPVESVFVELGAEALRGEAYPGAGAERGGTGIYTAFVHAGGDFNISNSWRAGYSRLRARATARETHDPLLDEHLLFTGISTINVADFVWKWAPDGNPLVTNFKLQGEYFWRDEEGDYEGEDGALPLAGYDASQSGWYLQAVYQFMPRWRVGLRHGALEADAVPAAFAGTVLDPGGHQPRRDSAMIDFSNSEYSRLRLQYNRDRSRPEADDQFFLQYIVGIGAHAAHRF